MDIRKRAINRFRRTEKNPGQAEDLAQDLLVKLLRDRTMKNLEPISLKAFADKQAGQVGVDNARARDAQKRGGRVHKVELDAPMAPAVSDPNSSFEQTILLLTNLLEKSENGDRLVKIFELYFLDDKKQDEIVALLEISRTTFARDITKIKQILAKHYNIDLNK